MKIENEHSGGFPVKTGIRAGNDGGAGGSGEVPPAGDPPAPAPTGNGTGAAPEGAPAGEKPQSGQWLSGSAFKRLKEDAKSKGAKARELEMAKEHGFQTVEEMQAFLKGARSGGQPAAANGQKKPQGNGHAPAGDDDPGEAPANMSRRAQAAWDREREKLARERDEARKQAAYKDKQLRQTRQEIVEKETRYAIREMAAKAGVRDLDYAGHLFEQYAAAQPEGALDKWDDSKVMEWFGGLREERPYLFGETVRPANTGTTGLAPPSPKPGAANGAAGNAGKKDFADRTKVSRQEFEESMRKRGLNPNAV